MFSGIHLANSFLTRSFRRQEPLTVMRLQRMLFFAHSDYLDRAGTQLLEERFVSWPYGPVLLSVQQKFGAFGDGPITSFATDAASNAHVADEKKHELVRRTLDLVWAAARPLTSAELSRIARDASRAWTIAHTSGQPLDDAVIAQDRPHLALYRSR